MEDVRGTRILILKDPLDEAMVSAMAAHETTRIVVRIYRPWRLNAFASTVERVREFWIEDYDAPTEIAAPFRNVVSLHLARPPADGFLSTFERVEECRLDGLTRLPSELGALGKLRSLSLGERCRLSDRIDFGTLRDLEKLVLSGASLSKRFSVFAGLEKLRFLGMSQWMGPDLALLGRASGLRESVLTHFPKAVSLNGLKRAPLMERLHLSSWSRLEDLSELSHLKKLKTLILEDCPSIASLEPLAGHPTLESVSLWGKTSVKDGRLRMLKETTLGLQEFRFNNRRHYDLKSDV